MTEFTDPLNDPRFPNRPNTPDYWRLSEIGLAHDGEAREGAGHQAVLAEIIDEPSLLYFAEQRLGTALQQIPGNPPVTPLLMAIYLDAFTMGAEFEMRGGHRES